MDLDPHLINEDEIFEWVIKSLEETKEDKKASFTEWVLPLCTTYFTEKRKYFEFEIISSPELNVKVETKNFLKGSPKDKFKLYMICYGGLFFDSVIGKDGNGLNLPNINLELWEKKCSKLRLLINNNEKNSKDSKLFKGVLTEWKNKLTKIETEKSNIVFVGESRIGKSTLINTILGQKHFLPVSPDSACTSGSITLIYAKELKLVFDLFSKEEMDVTVNKLLEELDNPKEHKRKRSEDSLKSILGTKKIEMNKIRYHEKIQNMWKNFGSQIVQTPKEIVKMQETLTQFMSNVENQDYQYWPFIKSCEIHVNFDILNHFNLIDLPGLHDFNPLREKVAKSFIEKSNFLILVSRYENLTTSPITDKIIKKDIIERGIHSCIVATRFDALSLDDVRKINPVVDKLSDDQVTLFERELINRKFLEKFSEHIVEKNYEPRLFYNQAKLISVPFFGVSSESFYQMKVNKLKTRFKTIEQTGIIDLMTWIQNHFLQKELDYQNLLDEIFHCKSKKDLNEINISNHHKQASNYLEEKIDEYLKIFFNQLDPSLLDCIDKSEPIILKLRKEIKWNTFRSIIRTFGVSKKVDINELFLKSMSESYSLMIPNFFQSFNNFLEKDFIRSIEKFNQTDNYKKILQNLKKMNKEKTDKLRKKVPEELKKAFEEEMKEIYIKLNEVKSQEGYFDKVTELFKTLFIESNIYKSIYSDSIDKVKRFYSTFLKEELNKNLLISFDEINKKNELSKEEDETRKLNNFLKNLETNKLSIGYLK